MSTGPAERLPVPANGADRPLLSPEVVDRFRRARITDALALVCLDRGYRGATIAHVATRAGTSRGTIYQHFENKEAIFLALLERVLSELEEKVDLACERADDPLGRIEAGLGAVLAWAAADPAAAAAVIVHSAAVSERAIALQAEALTGFADRLRSCSPGDRPRTSLEQLLVGGVTAILSARLISGGAASLSELLPGLTAFLAEPLLAE